MRRAAKQQLVMIGEIVRPHGLRGTVKVRATTENPQRFSLLQKVQLQQKASTLGEYVIERLQVTNKDVYLKFRGVNDRNHAEQLLGAQLMIAREQCLPLAKNEYYQFEIIGLPVYTLMGESLGEIVDIESCPANDVWVIRDGRREKLIPAIQSIIHEVDLQNRRVIITPIPGLLEDVPE
ncbi:MAG: ribosome maturation factor RimM [candidate division KSB1 bacterium]|nr:ribosome maturation factor RimM [candidate division KSB1 bacterium]MDZ7301264.1 ribosome maturation factor RimM [candidate division KSB1 bacterium]MDZ7310513.1 ribosome maturation factor RimM [candidate division KSB1 bacterium]